MVVSEPEIGGGSSFSQLFESKSRKTAYQVKKKITQGYSVFGSDPGVQRVNLQIWPWVCFLCNPNEISSKEGSAHQMVTNWNRSETPEYALHVCNPNETSSNGGSAHQMLTNWNSSEIT